MHFSNFPWFNNNQGEGVGLDEIFQGLFQQGFMMPPNMRPAGNAQGNGESRGAPPASKRAIRQLPTIKVSAEDLVEPSNRECCICLEENCLGDKVTRLPCAHIFHENCILDWLTNHHCTCPVCRYELPTDDPRYEAGRVERMKTRKPRFALYELKRMSIPELLALNRRPTPEGMVKKEDIIEMLVREERIHLVPAPEPVEYELKTLKEMRISELKHVMADAGVFFRTQDVVEKSDMLRIFLNSGRLNLLPSSGTEATAEETPNERTVLPAKRPLVVETVMDESDGEKEHTHLNENLPPPQEMFGNSSFRSFPPSRDESQFTDSKGEAKLEQTETNEGSETKLPESNDIPQQNMELTTTTDNDIHQIAANEMDIINDEETNRSLESLTSGRSSPESQYKSQPIRPYQEYTIAHLQDLARINNVDVSACFERSEIIDLLTNANVVMQHPSEVFRDNLSRFGVSELRVLASEVNIDLSSCNTKDEMLQKIVLEAMTERPHLQNYLRALSPLGRLSLSELKGTARDWGVNINDCLEKGEIMKRLITRGRRAGTS